MTAADPARFAMLRARTGKVSRASSQFTAPLPDERARVSYDDASARLRICRAVVAELGISRDMERTLETCPVVCEVLRRFDAADLGEAPFTLSEVGIILGIGRERVRQIQTRALQKLQFALRHEAQRIRDDLRQLDETRSARGYVYPEGD
jgi:hypothetical protein